MLEAELKSAVKDYLQYKMNLGEIYFDQLFTGEAIEVRGETRRKIQGCKKGTTDFFVLINGRIIFVECKGEKGRQSPGQKAFERRIREQGAEYQLIKTVEELQEVLRWYTDKGSCNSRLRLR